MPTVTPVHNERSVLLTLAGIQFTHILDFMIMMPLGPMLMKEFSINTHEFGLLVAAYSFSSALSGLLGAAFIDRFERKQLLIIMSICFGIATVACGLATSYAALLVFRGLAGVFGGVMGAMVQTMVGDIIPFIRRGKANGIISTAFSISTVAGVPLSLWIATHYVWRAPFFLIAIVTAIFIFIAQRLLPTIDHHLNNKRSHPFTPMLAVLRDANHIRALIFSALIIFSSFTVIPYLTVYAVNNVNITQHDIPLIYLAGGAATLITARLIGRWTDKSGKVLVYRLVALAAVLPIICITQSGPVPLWVWLLYTTAFFVLVSGRMIPAMTVIISAAQPKLRGTFMSLNSTVQSLAMGLSTTLGGFIVTQNASGTFTGYESAGYIAVLLNVLAIIFVSKIVMHDHSVAPVITCSES